MKPIINSPSFFIGKGGGNLISFGSGQPDLPPPAEAFAAMNGYHEFKYGLIPGQLALREALVPVYENSNPSQFVITNGGSEAIDLALRAIAVPGGKVLLPRPYYYSYPHNVVFAGMTPEYYDLADGKVVLEELEEKMRGMRAIMVNSPSNPTGTLQTPEVLKAIEEMAHRLGVYIIADNVYRDLVYVGEFYQLKSEKVITVDSFSKTYSMCGYRVGYVHAYDQGIIDRIVEMKTHTSMNTNILAQEMALAALKSPQSYIDEHLEIWRERRDRIYGGMKDLGLDLWQPEGAFYVFPRFDDPNKVVNELYYEYNIITYDGTWFGAPDRVRFSYALDVDKIDEGLKRLGEYIARK
ncbi:aminotransferase class I/II-fold pyridoxal phosphate-dependent enzyme [Candidatus Falkowbacteria bacterium]|nr:aminotransferase class I/II-fold pyridoxal phosphate-dependent enzyme [Candidatus Falkowbacteria bacterium]